MLGVVSDLPAKGGNGHQVENDEHREVMAAQIAHLTNSSSGALGRAEGQL